MKPYRLVATDLDGTLIDHSLLIPARTRAAIARVKEKAHFVLATGRMFQATLPFARELGIETPLITYQGAMIRDPKTGQDLWHHRMPLAETREAIELLRESGMHLNLYVDDQLVIEKQTPHADDYYAITRVPPRIESFDRALEKGAATKILAIGTVEQADTWLKELKDRLGNRLYITKSQANFLELAPLGISKGEALAFLAESLGVAREEVVAFGDGMNDAEMLTYAGLGVAMGNAADGLKRIADRVAPPIQEEGLAQVLEELF